MAFDSEKFVASANRLIKEPRQPRTVDVLIQHQAVVLEMLSAGLGYREIHVALTEAGWKVSYGGFAKAMADLLILLNLPSSRRAGLKQRRQNAALAQGGGRLPATPLAAKSSALGKPTPVMGDLLAASRKRQEKI